MIKKYIVRLCDEERQLCTEIVRKFKGTSQKVRRAQILLKADADDPAWTGVKIADAFGCRIQTTENLRKRLVTDGFEIALNGKKRPTSPTEPILDSRWSRGSEVDCDEAGGTAGRVIVHGLKIGLFGFWEICDHL